MIKLIYFKTDIKRIMRDAITALMMFAPILLSLAFRAIWYFVPPILSKHFGFDLLEYSEYMLAFVFVIVASLLSVVMGFSMQDDKDSHMTELIGITPLGHNGFMIMRLSMVSFLVAVYTILSYLIIGIYILPPSTILALIIMLCMYSSVMGIVLFRLAKDKVQGLTVAKGLNILGLFIFGSLIDSSLVNIICSLFPTYWIGRIILSPHSITNILLGMVVGIVWFAGAIALSRGKSE